MANNVVVSLFKVESEGYQAITELKHNAGDDKSYMTEAILVKKINGVLRTLDTYDSGTNTMNDTAAGGLIGALFGILGGPIGVLLGGAYGALIGSAIDAGDAVDNASVLEQIAIKMDDEDVAVIGLAVEEDEAVLDQKFQKYDTIIIRFDAGVVQTEVVKAQQMSEEMARQARAELREEKKAERKEKREAKKAEFSAKKEAKKVEKEAKKAAKEAE